MFWGLARRDVRPPVEFLAAQGFFLRKKCQRWESVTRGLISGFGRLHCKLVLMGSRMDKNIHRDIFFIFCNFYNTCKVLQTFFTLHYMAFGLAVTVARKAKFFCYSLRCDIYFIAATFWTQISRTFWNKKSFEPWTNVSCLLNCGLKQFCYFSGFLHLVGDFMYSSRVRDHP